MPTSRASRAARRRRGVYQDDTPTKPAASDRSRRRQSSPVEEFESDGSASSSDEDWGTASWAAGAAACAAAFGVLVGSVVKPKGDMLYVTAIYTAAAAASVERAFSNSVKQRRATRRRRRSRQNASSPQKGSDRYPAPEPRPASAAGVPLPSPPARIVALRNGALGGIADDDDTATDDCYSDDGRSNDENRAPPSPDAAYRKGNTALVATTRHRAAAASPGRLRLGRSAGGARIVALRATGARLRVGGERLSDAIGQGVVVFAAFGRNCGEPSLAAAARGLLHAPLFAGLGGPTSVAAAAASATPVTVLIVPQPTLAGDVTEGTHGACCIAYDGAAPAARGAALFAAFEHTLRRMAAELDARGDAARWLTVTAGEYGGRHSLQIDAGSDPFVHCFST